MKSPGRRNLRSASMIRANASAIHRMSLLSLVGILAFCGCNKTPPADERAGSADGLLAIAGSVADRRRHPQPVVVAHQLPCRVQLLVEKR